MSLKSLLEISPGVTAVIGGGGKTTLLETLGKDLAAAGHTVVLCATTKCLPFPGVETLLSPTGEELGAALARHRLVCAGAPVPGTGKLTAPPLPMTRLTKLAEYVLVEADGSAHRPLKAHETFEPVIPAEANQTICVVGASGFGLPIREAAHRPERFARLAGVEPDASATAEVIARVLEGEGLGNRYFINQADTVPGLTQARALARLLTRPTAGGSLRKGEIQCL